MPVTIVSDSLNVPVSPIAVQEALAHALVLSSPFSEVEWLAKETVPQHLAAGRFYLQAELLASNGVSYGSDHRIRVDLRVRILLKHGPDIAFQKRYTAEYRPAAPSGLTFGRNRSGLTSYLVAQWINQLIPDLNDEFRSSAWRTATAGWRVKHKTTPRVLVFDSESPFEAGRQLFVRVGTMLSERGCLTVVYTDALQAGDSFYLDSLAADYGADFVLWADWSQNTGTDGTSSVQWSFWSRARRQAVLQRLAPVGPEEWEVKNLAGAITREIGSYLYQEGGANDTIRVTPGL
jgi:hypothetical protein